MAYLNGKKILLPIKVVNISNADTSAENADTSESENQDTNAADDEDGTL